MGTSAYQSFKLQFLSLVPLAKDAVHIYVGFLCLLLALMVLRRPLRSYWVLLPGVAVSLAMELLDLRDDRSWLGYFRWAASLKDVLNTNAIPFLLVVLARRGLLRA
jgi:hypothetical protein